MEILPVPAGNIFNLYAVEGKLLYQRAPNTGAAPGPPSLFVYDIDKREEKPVLAGATGYVVSRDGKNILARDARGFG
jgi:tricorn protease